MYQVRPQMKDRTYIFLEFKISLFSTLSYVVDWVVYTLMLIVAANWGSFATTKTTDFSIADHSLMHSHIPESETYAPLWYLLVLTLLLPLIIIVVCCFWFLRVMGKKVMLWDIHSAGLGSYGCCTSQLLLVVILKNIAAVPRPDFLNRCQPDFLFIPVDTTLSTMDICTNLDLAMIMDGFRSFPSGHSSTIFSSQTFLVLFLIGKIKVSGTSYFSWKLVLSIMYPSLVAFKVSLSRVSDHRHKVTDVLMGDFIGLCFGFIFYFIYFANPFQEMKSIAYPPRKIEIDHTSGNPLGLVVSNYDFEPKPYTESINDQSTDIMHINNYIPFGFSTLPLKPKKSYDKHRTHKTINGRPPSNTNASLS